MAGAQSKRQSRKRRRSAATRKPGAVAPARSARAVASQPGRRTGEQGVLALTLTGKTYGEPPPNPFGGVPVSELAILVGAVGVVVGWMARAPLALVVGIVVVTLGVAEFSVREHFSGYRAHTALLAGIPAVAVGVAMIALFGGSLDRVTLLLVVIPVFAILFGIFRKRFRVARQARLVKPPTP